MTDVRGQMPWLTRYSMDDGGHPRNSRLGFVNSRLRVRFLSSAPLPYVPRCGGRLGNGTTELMWPSHGAAVHRAKPGRGRAIEVIRTPRSEPFGVILGGIERPRTR